MVTIVTVVDKYYARPHRIGVGAISAADKNNLLNCLVRIYVGFNGQQSFSHVTYPFENDDPEELIFMNCQNCHIYNNVGELITFVDMPKKTTCNLAVTIPAIKIQQDTGDLSFIFQGSQIVAYTPTVSRYTKLMFEVSKEGARDEIG